MLHGHTPTPTTLRFRKWQRKSTARRWLICLMKSRRPPTGKLVSSFLVLPGSAMTAPLPAPTGSIVAHGRMPAQLHSAAILLIPPVLVSTRIGDGHGGRIGA